MIIKAPAPSVSMSIKLAVSLGRNQIQRNTGNYNAFYPADGEQVTNTMIDIEPQGIYYSGSQSFKCLVLHVTAPVTVSLSTTLGASVLQVKRLLVIDQDITSFSLQNTGTEEVRASMNYVAAGA